MNAHACDLADHRSVRELFDGRVDRGDIQTTGGVEFIHHDAKTLGDDDFTARCSGGQFAADQRNTGFRRQHVDAGQFHHLGNGAARSHADAAPSRPIDGDAAGGRPGGAEARGDLAQQVIGGAVVGLSSVAEAAGNGAERHCRTQRHVADSVQED